MSDPSLRGLAWPGQAGQIHSPCSGSSVLRIHVSSIARLQMLACVGFFFFLLSLLLTASNCLAASSVYNFGAEFLPRQVLYAGEPVRLSIILRQSKLLNFFLFWTFIEASPLLKLLLQLANWLKAVRNMSISNSRADAVLLVLSACELCA